MNADDEQGWVDAYELVEQSWPYDGPYSDELTSSAALMISRLVRYLNNSTQKADGFPYVAVAGRILAELHATVAGYEQLLGQLARYLTRQATTDPSVYDDRRDRAGAATAAETAVDVARAAEVAVSLATLLAAAAQRASHLGSD